VNVQSATDFHRVIYQFVNRAALAYPTAQMSHLAAKDECRTQDEVRPTSICRLMIVSMTWRSREKAYNADSFPIQVRNSECEQIIGEDIMRLFSRSLTAALNIAAFLAMSGAARTWADDAPPPPKLRLPDDLAVPVRYRIELTSQTLEGIDLCVAYKKAQQASLTQFLERYGKEN
jgi:hypothetical protein